MRGIFRWTPLSGCSLGAVLACSSPTGQAASSPAGSVNGTVSGHALGVSDGLAVTNPNSAIPHVFVVLGSRSNLCSLLQGAAASAAATNQVADLTYLEFHVYDTRTSTFNLGTFPVPPANPTVTPVIEADVLFSVIGPTCGMVVHQWATSGTVTISALQPSVVGSYDLFFGSDHLTGSFDVSYCAGVNIQGNGSSSTPVCEQ
jgi:hypothetical protein